MSYRDLLLKASGPGKDIAKITAEDIMTNHPEVVKLDDPIAFVVNKMSMGGFRHVPVISADGAPLSIVTIKDVMAYLDQRD